jgi:integrase
MSTLRNCIDAEKTNQVKRHNFYVVYTYLALQFATTMRPNNNPELQWFHYNRRAGYIIIADKDSSKYREERTIFIPPVIQSLLNHLQDGWQTFSTTGRRRLCLSSQRDMANNVFFSINEDGELIPFKLQMIRDVYTEIGLEFNLPTNMPRHYTRTRLFNGIERIENSVAGIDNSVADILMGHVRSGREVFNLLSTTRLSDAANVYLPAINELLDNICISDVEYLVQ